MPRTSKRSAAAGPLLDRARVDGEGLGRRDALVVLLDGIELDIQSPAASWRTTLPHAMVSTVGCSSMGMSSRGRPNPMMSNITMGWS